MPEIEKNKKMPPIPEQFPEIESSCRHEGVDGVSDYPLEVVPIHSKVIFDMSNYRLNGHPSPEVLPHLSFLIGAVIFPGSTREKDACSFDHFFALVAPVTEYRLRSRSGDVFNLIQDRWKGMAIVGIVLEVHHPDKNIIGFGHGKGNLGAKFILLVILALGNAAHVRFMQTVDLVFAVSFLVMNPCKKVELIRIPGQPLLGKLALQFPDQNTGHGPDPLDDLFAFDSFHQQTRNFPFEASAQLDTAFPGDMAAFLNNLSEQHPRNSPPYHGKCTRALNEQLPKAVNQNININAAVARNISSDVSEISSETDGLSATASKVHSRADGLAEIGNRLKAIVAGFRL